MYKTIIIATRADGFSASEADNAKEKISAAAQYDFILGDWDIEAATMQPDRSPLGGSGVMSVCAIHDGQTLQADLQVQFVNETGFIGSTMRAYHAGNENRAASWVPAGAQAYAGGTAVWQGDRMVQTWPSAKD